MKIETEKNIIEILEKLTADMAEIKEMLRGQLGSYEKIEVPPIRDSKSRAYSLAHRAYWDKVKEKREAAKKQDK